MKYVCYYVIGQKLLLYQAEACYYIISQHLLHYEAVITLPGSYNITRQLLHYQAVITLPGSYYIIGCKTRQKQGKSSQIATSLSSEIVSHINTFVAAIL